MLSDPIHHDHPFAFFECSPAFGPEDCAALERAFDGEEGWQHRDDGFYSCFLRDVTDVLPSALLRNVAVRMGEITSLPLLDKVQVTVQRVEPGQAIGAHTDQPSVGYELARLVLQLNANWRPEHGGVLELYESADGPAVVSIEPRHNVAAGFVLHEGSFHGVTAVTRTRRSVVFNFWHAANSPELAEAVGELFADVHFSVLPSALDPVMAEAEATLTEEQTFRASLAAWALHRWGYGPTTLEEGYRHSAGLPPKAVLSEEERAAVRLADWVAGLHDNPFDLARWERLREDLGGVEPFARLMPIWRLCLPKELHGTRPFVSL